MERAQPSLHPDSELQRGCELLPHPCLEEWLPAQQMGELSRVATATDFSTYVPAYLPTYLPTYLIYLCIHEPGSHSPRLACGGTIC